MAIAAFRTAAVTRHKTISARESKAGGKYRRTLGSALGQMLPVLFAVSALACTSPRDLPATGPEKIGTSVDGSMKSPPSGDPDGSPPDGSSIPSVVPDGSPVVDGSLDQKSPTTNPLCAERAKRCAPGQEDTLELCVDGQWMTQKSSCPNACFNGECVGVCKPGLKKCGDLNNLTPYECDQKGEWIAKQPICKNFCSNGSCGGSCAPGKSQCSSSRNQTETCSAMGTWETGIACTGKACVDGVCIGNCEPSSVPKCSADQKAVQVCTADGVLKNVGEPCANGCMNGVCNVCKPNAKTCEGTFLKTCNATGTGWSEETACKIRCDSSALKCVDCVPTTETCNGLDDDCNGVIDDNVAPKTCVPSCAGTQKCVVGGGGTWSACGSTTLATCCGSKGEKCVAPSGGTTSCNGSTCISACPSPFEDVRGTCTCPNGGVVCDKRCVPLTDLCDGSCTKTSCHGVCIPKGSACPETTALELFYSDAREDNYSAGDEGRLSIAASGGYGSAGVVGYVLQSPISGMTTPLTCYWSATNLDNAVTAGTSPGSGYSRCENNRIEGYAFKTSQGSNTVAIKLWYNPVRGDYHTVSSDLQSDQYLSTDGGYQNLGVIGYVLRSP